jgi:hypothetical protein
VTNEGKGWHLHAHLLVDADWIDAAELARQWAAQVGQDFAIVKVVDARRDRDVDYAREVCKYAVKGSQLAGWSGHEIADYIDAMKGVRTFFTFGNAYDQRTAFKQFKHDAELQACRCEACGGTNFKFFFSEGEADECIVRFDEWRDTDAATNPDPPPELQPSLPF